MGWGPQRQVTDLSHHPAPYFAACSHLDIHPPSFLHRPGHPPPNHHPTAAFISPFAPLSFSAIPFWILRCDCFPPSSERNPFLLFYSCQPPIVGHSVPHLVLLGQHTTTRLQGIRSIGTLFSQNTSVHTVNLTQLLYPPLPPPSESSLPQPVQVQVTFWATHT
jgi:hypothetical protein